MGKCIMTDKQALKIHGYVFSSDSDDSSNSEGGKSEFDDKYYALRPPPVPFQGLENRIVKIKASGYATAKNRKKKDIHEGKAPISTTSNFPIQQNPILERKNIQKNNARRRRGQAQSNTGVPSPKRGQTQKTVGYTTEQPSTAQTSVWHNRRDLQYKDRPWKNHTGNPPQHLQANRLYNKEKPFTRVRSTEHTSGWFDVSNSSQPNPVNSNHVTTETTSGIPSTQNRPKSATHKSPYTSGSTITSLHNKEMDRYSTKNVAQVHNLLPFKQEPYRGTSAPMLATGTTNNASTSVGSSSSESFRRIPPKVVPSVGASQTKPTNISTIKGTYAEAAKRSSSIMEESTGAQSLLPRNNERSNTGTVKKASAGIDSNPTRNSIRGKSRSSNETESHKDPIFTITSNEPSTNYQSTFVMVRNQGRSSRYSNIAIISEPTPVPATEILLQNVEVASQEERSFASGFVRAFRKFCCCEVDENVSNN